MYIIMLFTEACVKGWFVYTEDKDNCPAALGASCSLCDISLLSLPWGHPGIPPPPISEKLASGILCIHACAAIPREDLRTGSNQLPLHSAFNAVRCTLDQSRIAGGCCDNGWLPVLTGVFTQCVFYLNPLVCATLSALLEGQWTMLQVRPHPLCISSAVSWYGFGRPMEYYHMIVNASPTTPYHSIHLL